MTQPADAHASPDASFLSVLYDITRKHPVIFIAIFLLPLIALVVSLVMKWHYVFTDTSHYLRTYAVDSAGVYGDSQPYINAGVDRVLRELDVAGLLGGIVGIFIGLFITVTTEKLNRSKERHNQQEMDRIKTQTSMLVQATESLNTLMIDVSGKVNEKVHMMEGTREVLNGITKVLESVRAQGNNLLVLSNTARIEGISPYRMEYVAKHANMMLHELRTLTQSGYAGKAEALQRDCTEVENTLKDVSLHLRRRGPDARVQFVTLNDEPQTPTTHPFLRYLGKVFNEHVVVEAYRPGSDAMLNPMDGTPYYKRFLVPSAADDVENPQQLLVQTLYEQHAQAIREMQELGIRVTKLAKTLPVQLFISAPIETKPGIYKGLSVCILGSGSSTSGRASTLTAFLTDDPHIVSSMTELFYDYENDAQMATREFMAPVLT